MIERVKYQSGAEGVCASCVEFSHGGARFALVAECSRLNFSERGAEVCSHRCRVLLAYFNFIRSNSTPC